MKKTSKLKSILSILLVFSICFSLTAFADQVDTFSDNRIDDAEARLFSVFESKAEMISDAGISISAIKTIYGFNKDEYCVIECEPSGYMIYHPESGMFVETSPSAPSPYLGLSGDSLYYCGPTEYYQFIDNEYIHIITDEKIIDSEVILFMAANNESLSEKMNDAKNIALLDYIENGNINTYRSSGIVEEIKPTSAAPVSGGLSTTKQNWFKNLVNCGYYCPSSGTGSDGVCGFVALNILYAYFDKFVNTKYMSDSYWTNSTKKDALQGDTNSFTKYLFDLDPKDSTTSMHIHSVSRQYLSSKDITDIDHTSLYWGAFTSHTIRSIIDDGYPVILFGDIQEPPGYNGSGKKKAHAVVAYKYTDSSYTVHYGWTNYSEVTITDFWLGSIYAMEVEATYK